MSWSKEFLDHLDDEAKTSGDAIITTFIAFPNGNLFVKGMKISGDKLSDLKQFTPEEAPNRWHSSNSRFLVNAWTSTEELLHDFADISLRGFLSYYGQLKDEVQHG